MSNTAEPNPNSSAQAQPAAFQLLQQQHQQLTAQRLELLQQNLQLQQQISVLHLINKLALQLNELTEPKQIFAFVAHQVAAGLGFEDCAIFLANHQQQTLTRVAAVGSRDLPDSEGIASLHFGQGIVGQCAASRQPVLVADTRQSPVYLLDVSERLSELAVPVMDQGELLAVIDCEQWEARFFDDTHLQILQHVASILSSRLRKLSDLARLEQSVQQLEYAELVQKALYDIASLSYDADQPQAFYQQIHQSVNSLIYAPNFYIALFDPQQEELHFPYFIDTTEHITPDTIYPKEILSHSLTGYVFRNEQPLLADAQRLAQLTADRTVIAYGSAPQCWLGVPFRSGEQVRGVVVVQSYDPDVVYAQKDLELLTFVSQHISSALERAFAQQRLIHQALHDALTNLPNRVLFLNRVQHAFKRRQRFPDKVVAVMYLDLDRFKMVNDTLGHQVGDKFLVTVSQLLKSCLRQVDTLARLGGDEFAILLEDAHSLNDVVEVAERIGKALEQPFRLHQHQLSTSASIGIALADVNSNFHDTDELIRRADIAMYQAKQDGRGIWRTFCEAMDLATTQHFQLEQELKTALAQQQFILYFQPIIDLASENTLGFEALVRWHHPERGLVGPHEFIPQAEELGLHIQLDDYVSQQAIMQLKLWRHSFSQAFYISINISGRSFSDADFAGRLLQQLAVAGVPASYLAIEITEMALIDNIAQARLSINSLRSAGVKVLLDDFGTGYSSLSYLHEFKLDVLKIDRSFIAGIRPRIQENPVVNTIITLAKTLGLQVIAEGIETSLQRKLLSDLGCDAGQGYWFSRPVPAKEAVAWLK
jgi:diguanylate cyclase (GGDEF)-like protein